MSSLKTFSVGTLKEVTEVEPNSDFAKPQKIEMSVTVNGVAGNEDIDYYEVARPRANGSQSRSRAFAWGSRCSTRTWRS